jgi:membrane associated rhomboid family serine protease
MAFPVRKQPEPTPKRGFRADGWAGASSIMGGLLVVLWLVQIINYSDHGRLTRFGLRPREVDGLTGIFTSPFLHANFGHVLANSLPFVALGWIVLISGLRQWLIATAIVILFDGVFTWLVAPAGLIVGVSGLVFGWFGYLIARAYFARKFAWIVIAIAVGATFSSLFSGLVPGTTEVSWQSHIGGFLGGIVAGAVLHPRRRKSGKVNKPDKPRPAVPPTVVA